MISGISLTGIDPTFDYIVSLMAPKRIKYSSTQFSSFEAMRDDFAAFGVLTVNVEHSDHTIFGSPDINWLFRAWHDSQHIEANADFSPEGEHIAASFQQSQIAMLQGPNMEDKRRWIALIDAEVNGQGEYFATHGEFPTDQRTFVVDYLLERWGLDASTFPRNLDGIQVRY
jgi:hypothetical protein